MLRYFQNGCTNFQSQQCKTVSVCLHSFQQEELSNVLAFASLLNENDILLSFQFAST